MAHEEQWIFCKKVKRLFPNKFKNVKVLDIGAFDVNGNAKFLFEQSTYIGLDIGEGPGVDIICPAQDYDAPDCYYDTIVPNECWEHNPYYAESIVNAVRMLKTGGLFLFTCATTGREIHGVKDLEVYCSEKHPNWKTMPNVLRENWDNNYYKNLEEKDIRAALDIEKSFTSFSFEVEANHCDLYFWG